MTSQPALTSLLSTSTVMMSQLCNPYDYSSTQTNYDLRFDMRLNLLIKKSLYCKKSIFAHIIAFEVLSYVFNKTSNLKQLKVI